MTTYCAPCLADLALVREAVTAVSGTAACMAHAVMLTHTSDTPQRRLTRLSELRTLAEGKLATASPADAPAIEILIQEYALAGAMDMTVPLRDIAGERSPRPPKNRRERGPRPDRDRDRDRGPRPSQPRSERGDRPAPSGADSAGGAETVTTEATAPVEPAAPSAAPSAEPSAEPPVSTTPAASVPDTTPAPDAPAPAAPAESSVPASAPEPAPTSTPTPVETTTPAPVSTPSEGLGGSGGPTETGGGAQPSSPTDAGSSSE
jgi:hypothetical protein